MFIQISKLPTSQLQTSGLQDLFFMVVHTEQEPPTHGCCLVGQHQAETGWDVSERWSIKPGLICPYAPLQ